MSSDSEEEFFDAEEVVPNETPKSLRVKDDDGTKETKLAKDLQAQREQLKEEQLLLEKKRQEEDRELEQKLEALRTLEHEEKARHIQQKDLEKRASENETKRQKLERLRQLMHEESTPNRSTPPAPSTLTPGVQKARDLAGQGHSDPAGQGHAVEQSEIRDNRLNDDLEKGQMLQRYLNDLESSFEKADTGTIDNTFVSCADTSFTEDSSQGNERKMPGEYLSITVNTASAGQSQEALQVSQEPVNSVTSIESVQTSHESPSSENAPVICYEQNEPDLIQSVKNSSLDRVKELIPPNESIAVENQHLLRSANAESQSKNITIGTDEPASEISAGKSDSLVSSATKANDESKSTKRLSGSGRVQRPTSCPPPPPVADLAAGGDGVAVTRPDMPPPPQVPPRRKKKGQSEIVTTTEIVEGSAKTSEVNTRPMSLGNLDATKGKFLTTSGCLLTAPSPLLARKPLDMSCVMMGERVVTAAEEECTRAVNDINLDSEVGQGDHDVMGGPDDDHPQADDANVNSFKDSIKSHSFPRSQSLTPSVQGAEKDMLETVSVLNLDTGQRVPLSEAEEKIPSGMNPLSLHIMRRTKEYLSDPSLHEEQQDAKTEAVANESQTITTVKAIGKKRKKIKKFFGKAKQKIKTVKDEVFHNTESSPSDSEEESDESRRMIKIKAANSHKGPYDFDLLVPVQEINNAHNGAVWSMKFSLCGRLLASGGQDNLLRVWALKDAHAYFDDMRQKYNEERRRRMSPTRSDNSGDSETTSEATSEMSSNSEHDEEWYSPFNKKPFCTYKGHSADILDISWSKNYFILTSSMDKTVRLWHVSRKECLCCFQHIDFVTAIAFHPKDDRYFLSGSLDGKLRLWNIPDKKVALWNEVSGTTKLITAANFCLNGKFAVVGTYDGRCVFYSTEQLKYYTQIHVRSTRGKNSKGRKVTGVEPFPGEDKILVTSNDSRIRLYDLRDLTLTCKYKGCVNNSSQIKASFSHTGRFLVCGSEDHFVYIWRVQHEFHKFSSARRDRSDYWESIKAHNNIVTVAMFSPKPNLIIKPQFEYLDSDDKQSTPDVRGEVLVSADYNGSIKVFINKFKPGSG